MSPMSQHVRLQSDLCYVFGIRAQDGPGRRCIGNSRNMKRGVVATDVIVLVGILPIYNIPAMHEGERGDRLSRLRELKRS